MTRRVLVLGAGGFLGRAIRTGLSGDSSLAVTAAARTAGGLGKVISLGDATDRDAVDHLIARCRPDVVVNAVGRRGGDSVGMVRDNLRPVENIIAACSRQAPEALILQLGSAAEYGAPASPLVTEDAPCRPTSPYGEAKLAATMALEEAAAAGRVRATVLRLFNVVGPGMGPASAPGAFLAQLAAAGPVRPALIRMGRIDTVRDFISLDDAVRAVGLALAAPGRGEVVNVCSGQGREVGAILRRMAELAGIAFRFETTEALGRTGDANRVVGAPQKAEALLGFTANSDLDPALAAAVSHALPARAAAAG